VPKVQWRTPDDGQRNCPKHAEFLNKNKFGKVSASVGFIKKKSDGVFRDERIQAASAAHVIVISLPVYFVLRTSREMPTERNQEHFSTVRPRKLDRKLKFPRFYS